MPYATAEAVRVLLTKPTLSPEEEALIESRIGKAERIIRRRIPDLDQQIAAGDLTAEDVADVIVEAVYRAVRNPEGLIQEADGNYSYMRSDGDDGSLEITDEEWESLGVVFRGLNWLSPKLVPPR